MPMKKHNRPIRHGHARRGKPTPTYRTWQKMLARCRNPNEQNFKFYGARGVRVCKRWESFDNFLADMGERPPGRTLDRWPDKNGDYEPGNARWATLSEQQQNRRDNHNLVIGGVARSISVWAALTGQDRTTIAKRIKRGWNHRDAVFGKAKRAA